MTETIGRVAQINVSPGGVPKLPVAQAHVGMLGLAGDGHNDKKHHGGPDRAVCLFSVEVIERLRAEGHPIAPGAIGENLTVAGIDFEALLPGDRLQVGEQVLLEITSYTTPCETIAAAFAGGEFARVAHKRHPGESRLYARVLREGVVAAGDAVRTVARVTAAADAS